MNSGASTKQMVLREESRESDAWTDCLGRIPYGSVLALFLCWVGVGLFCSMMYQAVNASIRQAQAALQIEPSWLDKVQLVFIIIAVVMGFFALVLLVVGALATGKTREEVYSGWRARMGGRIVCGSFLCATWLLYLCWLSIMFICACLTFVYLVFSHWCPENLTSTGQCIDLSLVALALNGTLLDDRHSMQLNLCGSDLQQFCTLTQTALPWYLVGFSGGIMVLLSLMQFMLCLAANYAHIKDEIKYMELIEMDEMKDYQMRQRSSRF